MRRFFAGVIVATVASGLLLVGVTHSRTLFAPTSAPSGALAWQLIAHTAFASSTTGGTSAAINCSSAGPNALMIINIGDKGGPATPTITDSSSNTYTKFAGVVAGAGDENQLYYSITGTVTSSMTATVTFGTSTQPSFEFACFKSNGGAILVDASNSNSNNSSSTTLQTGTLTPFNNNSLVIAGMGGWAGLASSVTFSINSGFSLVDQQNLGTGLGTPSALAYFLQSTSAALNPTWTATSAASEQTATIAAFTTTAIPQVAHVSDSHAVITSSSTTLTFPGLTAPTGSTNAWVGKLIIETTSDLITSAVAGSNTLILHNPTLCHSSSFFCYGFHVLNLTGAPTSIVVTLSGAPAGTFHDVQLSEYSGAVAFGVSALNDTAGSSNNLTITPTSTHNLVWSGLHSGASVTFPAGFTTRLNDTADGDYSADFQQQNAQALGVAWVSSIASDQAVLTLVP